MRPGRRTGPDKQDEQMLPGVPVKLREFLGIDKEHDVAITRKEPDYRYTSWNGQLLAERKQQEASVGQGQEQEPEEKAGQERQTHFRR
ncbi:hypothetical protein SFC43_17230 [Bacteroides sp. CR5/BHMF/2]|nr:hypothetical protein [Bacteroides sp. CR5/BHMF/2]